MRADFGSWAGPLWRSVRVDVRVDVCVLVVLLSCHKHTTDKPHVHRYTFSLLSVPLTPFGLSLFHTPPGQGVVC